MLRPTKHNEITNTLFTWESMARKPRLLKFILQLNGHQNSLINGTPFAHLLIKHAAPLHHLNDIIKSQEDANKRDKKGRTALHMAVMKKSLEAVEILLALGADPNIADHKMKTPLQYNGAYCRKNDREIKKMLINQGALINAQDKHGKTVLHSALENEKWFQWLVYHHADIRVRDKKNRSIAYYAAIGSSIDIMRIIIAAGGDLDAEDKKGYTPLLYAASYERWQMVNFLLPQTKNISTRNKKGFNLLTYMLRKPGISISELENIIQLGASIDIEDTNSLQMTMAACAFRFDLVKWLHDKGVPLTRNNSLVLHAAILKNNIENVTWLLQHGADPEAVPLNRKNYTPFSVAIFEKNIEIIKLLLKHNVNVLTKNAYGNPIINDIVLLPDIDLINIILTKYSQIKAKTALFYQGLERCAEMKRWPAAKLLIKIGELDVTSAAFDEVNIFHHLPISNMKELNFASWLHQRGANVNKQDHDGDTALHLALRYNNKPKIAWLFPLIENFRAINNNGQSLLHMAARHGEMTLLKNILTHPLDVNAKCNLGYTALHYALSYHHIHVYQYLLNLIEITLDDSGLLLLHLAIAGNEMEIMLNLIKRGLSPTAKVKRQDGLDVAISSERFAMAARLLTEKSINFKLNSHHQHLITAAGAGEEHLVTLLLERGVDINFFDKHQMTPLFAAIENKQWPVVNLLIAHRADLSMKSVSGNTALHLAAIAENVDLCEKLKKSGIKIHKKNHAGSRVCDIAFWRGDWPTFAWCLENGIHPDVPLLSQDFSVPNRCLDALKKGHLFVAKWMHENNISLDTKHTNNFNYIIKEMPLIVARAKQWHVVDYLIEAGVNLTNDEVDALLCLAILEDSLSTVTLLYTKKNGDFNLCGYASHHRKWDIVYFLLSKEMPDLDAVYNIVQYASMDGNLSVINKLFELNVGLEIHQLDKMLSNAVRHKHFACVESLLAKGARCSYALIEKAIFNRDWPTAMALIKHLFQALTEEEKIDLVTQAIWCKKADIIHYVIKADPENKERYMAMIKNSCFYSIKQYKQQLLDLTRLVTWPPGLTFFSDESSPAPVAAPVTAQTPSPTNSPKP